YRSAIAATNSSRVAMLIRLIPDPADEHRPGANQMRQWLSFRDHSRRGNAASHPVCRAARLATDAQSCPLCTDPRSAWLVHRELALGSASSAVMGTPVGKRVQPFPSTGNSTAASWEIGAPLLAIAEMPNRDQGTG